VERAIVLGSTDEILPEDLPETLIEASSQSDGAPVVGDLHEQVQGLKRRAVIAAFRKANHSYTEAAKLLGVHANYLHRLIKNLGIKATLETLDN
jgi:DNA-binding NtrC family response regulator